MTWYNNKQKAAKIWNQSAMRFATMNFKQCNHAHFSNIFDKLKA